MLRRRRGSQRWRDRLRHGSKLRSEGRWCWWQQRCFRRRVDSRLIDPLEGQVVLLFRAIDHRRRLQRIFRPRVDSRLIELLWLHLYFLSHLGRHLHVRTVGYYLLHHLAKQRSIRACACRRRGCAVWSKLSLTRTGLGLGCPAPYQNGIQTTRG